MAKARDNNLPQHDLKQGHYGALQLDELPDGATSGDVIYRSGSQWVFRAISGLAASGGDPSPFEFYSGTDWKFKAGYDTILGHDITKDTYLFLSQFSKYTEIGAGSNTWFTLDDDVGKAYIVSQFGFVWPLGTSDPGGGDSENGQAYYNEATHHFRGRVSGTWVNLDDAVSSVAIAIDNGASVITTGIKSDIPIFFDCSIVAVELLANISGSIVVDIWKDTYGNYPPTVADSITAAAKPTLSSQIKSLDTTLSGWTTNITAGDTLRFNVDSASTVNRVTLALKLLRT